MSKDPELEIWQKEWQSLGGREALAHDLTRRVLKDGQRIQRGIAREIAGSLFGVGLCIWLLVRTHGDPVATVACAGVLLFIGIWITRLLTLRQGSLQTMAEGLDAFVELTRRRLTDDLRWSGFASRALQILAALLVPWSVWALIARWPMYRAEPWRAVVGFGSAATILAFNFAWNRKKRRKLEAERERFEMAVAERTIT